MEGWVDGQMDGGLIDIYCRCSQMNEHMDEWMDGCVDDGHILQAQLDGSIGLDRQMDE